MNQSVANIVGIYTQEGGRVVVATKLAMPDAEAVAKEIVANIRADGDTPYAYRLTRETAVQAILDFAAQQVREVEARVWGEAADYLKAEHSKHQNASDAKFTDSRMDDADISYHQGAAIVLTESSQEFRRRSRAPLDET